MRGGLARRGRSQGELASFCPAHKADLLSLFFLLGCERKKIDHQEDGREEDEARSTLPPPSPTISPSPLTDVRFPSNDCREAEAPQEGR